MKTQANDKDARRRRRAQNQAHKTYGQEKQVKVEYYTMDEDTQEDLQAAIGSLNIPTKGDWYY